MTLVHLGGRSQPTSCKGSRRLSRGQRRRGREALWPCSQGGRSSAQLQGNRLASGREGVGMHKVRQEKETEAQSGKEPAPLPSPRLLPSVQGIPLCPARSVRHALTWCHFRGFPLLTRGSHLGMWLLRWPAKPQHGRYRSHNTKQDQGVSCGTGQESRGSALRLLVPQKGLEQDGTPPGTQTF